MNYFKSPKNLILSILLLGLLFRIYQLETFYVFNHDQDLYSWIIKDILVDKHFRLIGQLTSIDGVFIGPLFYYMLVPFFAIFNLNPLAATIPVIIIGLATVYSFYWILSHLFDIETGLIAAFLYSISWANAFYDRWVVPTQPTVLWSIWYLYAILMLAKGNFRVLPLLGILLGLVWHIHIALAPLAALIPIALIFSKDKPALKQFIQPIALSLVFTIPFWGFEFRHNFQQIKGFLDSLSLRRGEAEGLFRAWIVVDNAARSLGGNLFFGIKLPFFAEYLLLGGLSIYLYIKKTQLRQLLYISGLWILLIFLAQEVSKRGVSEYYFANIVPIAIAIFSLVISQIYRQGIGKALVKLSLLIFLVSNIFFVIKMPMAQDGYLEKLKLVDYIRNDAKSKGYECISINYIAQFGTDVGFRYLFWWRSIDLIRPGDNVPIYNIVIPWSVSGNEIDEKFGALGVILPKQGMPPSSSTCKDPNNELTPLLGFTR